jgi:hypothetical protein
VGLGREEQDGNRRLGTLTYRLRLYYLDLLWLWLRLGSSLLLLGDSSLLRCRSRLGRFPGRSCGRLGGLRRRGFDCTSPRTSSSLLLLGSIVITVLCCRRLSRRGHGQRTKRDVGDSARHDAGGCHRLCTRQDSARGLSICISKGATRRQKGKHRRWLNSESVCKRENLWAGTRRLMAVIMWLCTEWYRSTLLGRFFYRRQRRRSFTQFHLQVPRHSSDSSEIDDAIGSSSNDGVNIENTFDMLYAISL